MKTCPKCGAAIQEDAKFCTICGALLEQTNSPSARESDGAQQEKQSVYSPAQDQQPEQAREQEPVQPPSQQAQPNAAPPQYAGQPYPPRPAYPNYTPNQNPYPPQPKFNPYVIPGQQPVGFHPYPPMVQPGDPSRNGLAVAALVMGILAIVFSVSCWGGLLFGILGTIFGGLSLKSQKNGMAKAGLIMSIIALVLCVILLVFVLIVGLVDATYYPYGYTDYLHF